MKQPRSAKRAAALAMMNEADRQRFERLCGQPTETGCVPWLGCKDTCGYGRFGVRYVIVSAHRAAFTFAHGRQPDTVLHTCDNPACVNVAHMREGTQLDNIADRHAKGRNGAAYGEHNASSKLCWFVVDLIRSSRLSAQRLGDLFGVSKAAVESVRQGKTWRENCGAEMPKAGA